MHVEQSQLLKREQFLLFPRRRMYWTWSKHRFLHIYFSFHFFSTFSLELLLINLRENLSLIFFVISLFSESDIKIIAEFGQIMFREFWWVIEWIFDSRVLLLLNPYYIYVNFCLCPIVWLSGLLFVFLLVQKKIIRFPTSRSYLFHNH